MEIAESTITGDRLVYGLELENESSSRGEEPGVASFKLGVWSGGRDGGARERDAIEPI